MPTTSTGIVNDALQLIGSQATITSLTQGTVEANAANIIYTPTVQLLLRQLDPDFARATVALVAATASGGVIQPWQYEYLYPSTCIRARQVRPPKTGTGALADPYNPLPILAEISFDPQGGGVSTPAKVILSNQQNAWLTHTTNAATETMFDAGFVEALTRRLANPLAMAIAGRPDFARELLEEAERYAGMSELADDSVDGRV